MDKVILFDMDRTIFNTNLLIRNIKNLIASTLNISEEKTEKTINNYLSSLPENFHFDFSSMLKKFNPTEDTFKNLLSDCQNNSSLYPAYPDTIPTLKLLKRKGLQIGIFSEGNPQFQLLKFKHMRIEKFTNKDLLFIRKNKKDKKFLNQLPKDSIIVDDKKEIVEMLSKTGKFNPIQIKRERNSLKPNIHNQSPYPIISSLTEILYIPGLFN